LLGGGEGKGAEKSAHLRMERLRRFIERSIASPGCFMDEIWDFGHDDVIYSPTRLGALT